MKFKITLTHLVYAFLIGAFGYTIYTYRDQLSDIVDVFQRGVWYFLLASLLVLALTIFNQAALYSSIYSMLGLPSNHREFLPLYLVRRFVLVAAPSGGFSGWVPFIQFARKRDISVGTVFVANLIYTILWYSAFGVFMLVGLIYLFVGHDLQWFEISAALIMMAADAVMIALLIAAWIAPQMTIKIFAWVGAALRRISGWLRRQPPFSAEQLLNFAGDLNEGIAQMRRAGWRRMLIPTVYALANEALNMGMFFLVALAFGVEISLGVLVAAYSVSILFWVVVPTPGGLGVVEGTLILVLTTLGVSAGASAVVTLAYRGITFWLPFVLGFGALRWFNRQQARAGEA